jgi:ubiquinone/menaquinone biosynthesis C-methylase UbiE
MASAVPSASSGYVYDNGSGRSADLHRLLREAYDPMTVSRLRGTGVTAGWHCLEVGAGGGSIAVWLAGRVAPAGSVIATDIDTRQIPAAPGLTVARHDIARDSLPDGSFDLIHARTVLCWLPEREAVVHRLVRALKPGGVLQIDEVDASHTPPLVTPDERSRAMYETYLRAKAVVWATAGADGTWACRLPQAMHDAGLSGLDVTSFVEPWHAGSPGLRLQALHTIHARARFLAAGMTDPQLAEVRAVMGHPDFRASSTVFYSVQGRRRG